PPPSSLIPRPRRATGGATSPLLLRAPERGPPPREAASRSARASPSRWRECPPAPPGPARPPPRRADRDARAARRARPRRSPPHRRRCPGRRAPPRKERTGADGGRGSAWTARLTPADRDLHSPVLYPGAKHRGREDAGGGGRRTDGRGHRAGGRAERALRGAPGREPGP